MADTKISALPEVTTPAGTDVLPIVSAGVTKKITVQNLAVQGRVGPAGPRGLSGTTGLPAGSVTGQVPRYNATANAWETASEPFAFKGLVLTPALASLIDTEGAIYYNSTTKSVMVCTQI